MKKPRILKGSLEIFLLICVILLIPLLFAVRSLARQQGLEPTPVPTKTVVPEALGMTPTVGGAQVPANVATVAPAPVAQGKQPSACTFPLAKNPEVSSKPDNYTFSEPQIVLTNPDNLYNVVEWLPDSQQVLITEDLFDTREAESDKYLRQSIKLYNPITGVSNVYAIRHFVEEPPAWQPGENAVVYADRKILGVDEKTHQFIYSRQVWASLGNPKTIQMLADNLPQFALAIKPDGSSVVFQSDTKLSRLNASLKGLTFEPFDPNKWDYAKSRQINVPLSYKMAWQPATSLIFLYGDGVIRFSGYTFILDSDTGQVCELNLGGGARRAKWSSDGRYLAIIRTNDHFPINSSDLAVLDSVTGNVYSMRVTSEKIAGKHFVDDFAWAPDNFHLVAISRIRAYPITEKGDDVQSNLYLVDFRSGLSDEILSTINFAMRQIQEVILPGRRMAQNC